MRRGEIWTLSETEAVMLIGSDLLHENGFPITYGLPVRAEHPDGLDYPYVVHLDTAATGFGVDNWVHTYAMHTIRTSELQTRLAIVADRATHSIDEALRTIWHL